MIDLEKLREMAQDANTAEQWYAAHDMTSCSYDYDKAFIAASSPAVVLELLNQISQLEKDAGRWRFLCEKYDVSLLTTFFGNGCINKKIDDVNRAIDTAMEANHG